MNYPTRWDRLVATDRACDAYRNSAFFRRVVSMARRAEDEGEDPLDALREVLLQITEGEDAYFQRLREHLMNRPWPAPGTPEAVEMAQRLGGR